MFCSGVKEVIEILNVFIGKSLWFKVLCDMVYIALVVSSARACARLFPRIYGNGNSFL